jgi:hypothetical protein
MNADQVVAELVQDVGDADCGVRIRLRQFDQRVVAHRFDPDLDPDHDGCPWTRMDVTAKKYAWLWEN